MQKKWWSDLTATQKWGIMLLGTIQLALLAAVLIDIRCQPADQSNGSKRLWTTLVFVNFIGPIAYFLFERKRPATSQVAV